MKKKIAMLLAVMMVLNLFVPIASQVGNEIGLSFAATNDYYNYDPGNDEGEGYYYHDGTGKIDEDSGNVLFSDLEDGMVLVQDYDVSDIGWLTGNAHLWTRENMFREDRVIGTFKAVTSTRNTGYGNGSNVYYTDYVFYTQASWNGNKEQGGMAKTARRIKGYYTADKTGYYQFQVSTDDGHYINFYTDDIFYNPKYDYFDNGDYSDKWYRYYSTGVNPIIAADAPLGSTVPAGTMKVTSSVTTTLDPIYMKKGEVYPFYIEYFNWGGGGKFYFNERYKPVGGTWSSYNHIDTGALHPDVVNKPRVPGNSGIDLTVEDGVRTIHAYDNFNGDKLDDTVWENVNNFALSNGFLRSNGNLSSIKLKKNYQFYDSYEMTLDLVNVEDQNLGYSNGGFGISADDTIWTHHTKMDRGENNDKWYRTYGITEYGSISDSNTDGTSLKADVHFDEMIEADEEWQNKPIKMKISAKISQVKNAYDVTTTFYYADGDESKLKEITNTFTSDELDFNKIYLASIQPVESWVVSFDNFDFVAKKNLKFDSLRVDWKDHKYGLTWDLVPGATSYSVNYQTGIDSAGKPVIVEYPLSASDLNSVLAGELFIPDTSTRCNYPYKVVAHLEDFDMTSNTVYVGGNASNLTLSGFYDGDDYKTSWNDLEIENKDKIQDYTYSLYYRGENETSYKQIEGAQDMNKATSAYVFSNLQTSDEYYGKYLQLVANVQYSDNDILKFYSNEIKVISNVRLGISHANDHYILGWKSELDFSSYRLYRDAVKSSFDDKNNMTSPYNVISNIYTNIHPNGYIYYKVADTDTNYVNKHYIVAGNNRGLYEYSNIVYAQADETTPTLVWLPTASGSQLYQWTTFEGATAVELYYGDSADDVNTLMSNDEMLLDENKFESDNHAYEDKYVQARFLKNGIWYYTNIVRTRSFDDFGGRIENNEEDESKYDFVLNWEKVKWPEDGTDSSERVSYYELYYVDDSGNDVLVQTNLSDNTYRISDIYGEHTVYLQKEMFVRAVCPIEDQFGFKYNGALLSPKIIPRKVEFTDLDGLLNEETFTLTWNKPQEMVNEIASDLDGSSYDILFGPTKSAVDTKVVENLDVLSQEWAGVTETGAGKEYYHKFFKIEAKIDGVSYLSNTAYSGEKPELRISRFNNDFKLNWALIENADAIKVYYADEEDSTEYTLYEAADLNGNATTYTLEDMANNQEFDGKYYKIAAVFDGFEIQSNAVKVDSSRAIPVLSGKFNPTSGDYDLTWAVVDWANDGYKLYYEDEKSDDSNLDDSAYVEVTGVSLSKSDSAYSFDDVANNPYKDKYVRLKAIDGYLTAYSNAVYVEHPSIDGKLAGLFAEEEVKINLSSEIDIIYTFNVYKEMKMPYFKMELNGSKYLRFDKTSAYLNKTVNGTSEELPIRLVSEYDDVNGVTTLYAHLLGEEPTFSGDDNAEYKLVVSSSIEVNEPQKEAVYTALRAYKSYLENWELGYYVADDELKIEDHNLGEEMFVRYEAHWNVDDRDSVGNERQSSKEMFNVDIEMKNKDQLPSSL
jgi:hypothetical protein